MVRRVCSHLKKAIFFCILGINPVQTLHAMDADLVAKHIHIPASLYRATEKGLTETVVALLVAVTDINSKNNGGWALLHVAAQNGRKGLVKLFLDRGATFEKTFFARYPNLLNYEPISPFRAFLFSKES